MAIQPTTIALINLILIVSGCVGLIINDYVTALPTIAILLLELAIIIGVVSMINILFSINRLPQR
jgi:hypothetical protein